MKGYRGERLKELGLMGDEELLNLFWATPDHVGPFVMEGRSYRAELLRRLGERERLREALQNIRAIAEGTPDAWTSLSNIGNVIEAALEKTP